MRILITNDDGIDAPGIALLERSARTLSDDVWVVAPALNQSSCGRALTQTRGVDCSARGPQRFAISGTPGDCVLIALNYLLETQPPDLILSGVNRGSNLAEDIHISGTVGACLQGWEQRIPSIAISQVLEDFEAEPACWEAAIHHLDSTLAMLVPLVVAQPCVINMNLPPLEDAAHLKGLMVTELGHYAMKPSIGKNASGQFFYPSMRNRDRTSEAGDLAYAWNGYITLTPLTLDVLDTSAITRLKQQIETTHSAKTR